MNFNGALRSMRPIQKILVFSFSRIGDAALSTCMIQPLKRAFPSATLTYLVGPAAVPLLAGDPEVDAIYSHDREQYPGWKGRLRLVRELRRHRFDLVVDLRDAPYTWLIGAKRLGIGAYRQRRQRHIIGRFLDILERAGIPTEGARPHLTITPEEQVAARDWLCEQGISPREPILGLHPGGNWVYKLWPAERFGQVGDALRESHGAQTLVFAGPEEESLRTTVLETMRHPAVSVKDVSLRMLSALIQACDVYVGNDTGPMHMADALGTRVVALFEPTNDVRMGPYGKEHTILRSPLKLGCNPCYPGNSPGGCGQGFCESLFAIETAAVVEAVQRQMDAVLERKANR
jgi:ADP-heptose:LPS heptosyltransferase